MQLKYFISSMWYYVNKLVAVGVVKSVPLYRLWCTCLKGSFFVADMSASSPIVIEKSDTDPGDLNNSDDSVIPLDSPEFIEPTSSDGKHLTTFAVLLPYSRKFSHNSYAM